MCMYIHVLCFITDLMWIILWDYPTLITYQSPSYQCSRYILLLVLPLYICTCVCVWQVSIDSYPLSFCARLSSNHMYVLVYLQHCRASVVSHTTVQHRQNGCSCELLQMQTYMYMYMYADMYTCMNADGQTMYVEKWTAVHGMHTLSGLIPLPP